jgi:hypothetical protein
MMDLRGGSCLTQEARPYAGNFRNSPVDYLERDNGIQNGVACAIGDRHCSSAELDRKTVHSDFHLEVIVLQRSRRQSPGCFGLSWFLTTAQKTEISQTTKASAILRERSSANYACSDGWLAFHTSKSQRSI